MEIKAPGLAAMGLGVPEFQGCQNSKLQAERISNLQEKKRSLQTLLGSRQKELRQVCLLEAELTGKLPYDFPLEVGEQPPIVQRRAGKAFDATSKLEAATSVKSQKEQFCHFTELLIAEDDLGHRKQVKTGFSGALHQSIKSDKNILHNKRTAHRGCHTDNFSSSVVSKHRSLSHPRLASSSPDSCMCKTLSPVEIYYEMRTCHNAPSSSISPSHSLTRSASNEDSRSVPATPIPSQSTPVCVHVRSDMSGDLALKQWDGSADVSHFVPMASLESFSSEPSSYTYNSLARRSNSSDALLDRSCHPQPVASRNVLPPRTGRYKSSESLTDNKLRHMYHGSPERQLGGSKEQGHMHLLINKGSVAGYSETCMDCMRTLKKRPVQSQQHFSDHIWPNLSAVPKSGTSAHCNVFPHSQMQVASATPSYSPAFVQNYQTKPCQAKVTRTKSCGPFTPLQQHTLDNLLAYAHEPTNLLSSSTSSSFPNLLHHQTEMPNSQVTFSSKPGPFSLPAIDDSARSLHKALALEGLWDWYLRNALGYPTAARGQDGARFRTPLHLVKLPWSVPLGPLYTLPQIPQLTSFHGHPLHGRYVELSQYSEHLAFKETAQKESNLDPPSTGTLV